MRERFNLLLIIFFSFFVLPIFVFGATDSVNIQVDVDNCNNNGICEPSLGETYSGCPLDLCEPPPVVSTTTSTASVTSGSFPKVNNFLNKFIETLNYFFNSYVFVRVNNIDQNGFSIDWTKGLDKNYFRLVKSQLDYPKNAFDGFVVFEGVGNKVNYESNNKFFYYGLFELGPVGFVQKNYFTTPDKLVFPSKTLSINGDISSLNFPKTSINVLENRLEIIQDDKKIPINNNEITLDANMGFFVNIFPYDKSSFKFSAQLSKLLSESSLFFDFDLVNNTYISNIFGLNRSGRYILRINSFSSKGIVIERREILINFVKKSSNNFNFCDQNLFIRSVVCYESVGPFFHLKNLWDF